MDEEDNCTICGEELNDNNNNKITLRCKHEYHYCCLVEALKSKLNYNGKMKIGERCCPYCSRRILPIKYRTEHGPLIVGIHRPPTDLTQKPPKHTYYTVPYNNKKIKIYTCACCINKNNPLLPPPPPTTPPPPNNLTQHPICSGICKNGQHCKFKAKYAEFCGHHKQTV
jgi:hypothetical protein